MHEFEEACRDAAENNSLEITNAPFVHLSYAEKELFDLIPSGALDEGDIADIKHYFDRIRGRVVAVWRDQQGRDSRQEIGPESSEATAEEEAERVNAFIEEFRCYKNTIIEGLPEILPEKDLRSIVIDLAHIMSILKRNADYWTRLTEAHAAEAHTEE